MIKEFGAVAVVAGTTAALTLAVAAPATAGDPAAGGWRNCGTVMQPGPEAAPVEAGNGPVSFSKGPYRLSSKNMGCKKVKSDFRWTLERGYTKPNWTINEKEGGSVFVFRNPNGDKFVAAGGLM